MMAIKQKGFSLVEIMVATGLLAALSLGVMSTMQTMKKGQVQSETKLEELELRRLISSALTDKTACLNTLNGINIGADVPNIKNSAGTILYAPNTEYGNHTIKITSMRTEDKNLVNSDGTRDVDLIVAFQKIKKLAGGTNTVSFRTTLRVKATSGTAPITACFSDTEQTVAAATESTCLSIGGTWNAGTSTCTISNFVLKAGDVMTGNLTAPQFCTGGNCRAISELALSNQSCPNGEVANGVKADGTPNCKALQCPANQFFAGLDASNNVVCRPYPTNTCPTDQYVSQVNADGTVSCAMVTNDVIWQKSGSDIYYNIGNVGIGTTSPAQKLDITGGGAAIRGQLFLGDGVSSDIRKVTASTPLYFRNSAGVSEVKIDTGGSVGIGTTNPQAKLDVNGEARIGTTGLTCNASTAGAMRYSGGAIQYCNGSAWTGMGGGVTSGTITGGFDVITNSRWGNITGTNTCPAGHRLMAGSYLNPCTGCYCGYVVASYTATLYMCIKI